MAARPTIFMLLPGWHPEDLNQFPELTKRRWVEFKSLDDESTLKELAQRVVDGAYELAASRPEASRLALPAAAGRRLMVYIPARSQTSIVDSLRHRLSKEPELQDARGTGTSTRRRLEPDALEDLAAELSGAIDGAVAAEADGGMRGPHSSTSRSWATASAACWRASRISSPRASTRQGEAETLVSPGGSHRAVRLAEPGNREATIRMARQTRERRWFGRGGQPHSRSARGLGSDHESPDSLDTLSGHVTRQHPSSRSVSRKGDQWVDRKDSLDIEQFPNAWQSDVPGATHTDVHQVTEGDLARYAILRKGILEARPAGLTRRHRTRRNPVVIVSPRDPRGQRDVG